MLGLNKNFNSFSQINSINLQKNSKKSLRAFYKRQVDALSSSLKTQKQKQIINLLAEMSFWKKASYIAAYRALKDEPCLSSFYSLWKDKICFPVIKNSLLEFYQESDQWQKNNFSIFEPVPEEKNKVPLNKISIFLIPGRVFDRRGGRLGRGKGYYDKTLALIGTKKGTDKNQKNFIKTLKTKPLFIGVAFSEQVHNEKLPLLDHDILFDFLVTDSFVLKPLNQKGKV